MNKFAILLFLLLIMKYTSIVAQCTFTPTVVPAQPVLCPNASDTLWTQEYEAYQWYKNNNPIAGATNQFHIVTENDLLKQFKVAATQEGCTENSASVLVDGWVFLLPYVIQSGDMGTFDPNTQSFVLCPGDTMILEMGQPYIENVQWFDNGLPISGANSSTYYVSESGSYTACGAPAVCPEYQDCMLIPIDVFFSNTPAPVITQSSDTLFSSAASSYQWFLNGNMLPGATGQFYIPMVSGIYTVSITDDYDCSIYSDAFNFIATGNMPLAYAPLSFTIFPNPANDRLSIVMNKSITDHYLITITDIYGRVVSAAQNFSGTDGKIEFNTGHLAKGNYLMRISSNEAIAYEKFVIE